MPAVWLQNLIDVFDDVLDPGSGSERKRHVVERAHHVVGGGECIAPHPQNPEPLGIGKHDPGWICIRCSGRSRCRRPRAFAAGR
jgi:hypothetical protein